MDGGNPILGAQDRRDRRAALPCMIERLKLGHITSRDQWVADQRDAQRLELRTGDIELVGQQRQQIIMAEPGHRRCPYADQAASAAARRQLSRIAPAI